MNLLTPVNQKQSFEDYDTDHELERRLLNRAHQVERLLIFLFPYGGLAVLTSVVLARLGFERIAVFPGLSIIAYLLGVFLFSMTMPRPRCGTCKKRMKIEAGRNSRGQTFPLFYVCTRCKRKAYTGTGSGS